MPGGTEAHIAKSGAGNFPLQKKGFSPILHGHGGGEKKKGRGEGGEEGQEKKVTGKNENKKMSSKGLDRLSLKEGGEKVFEMEIGENYFINTFKE